MAVWFRRGAVPLVSILGVCGTLVVLAYVLETGHLAVLRRHMRQACEASALAAAAALGESATALDDSSPALQEARAAAAHAAAAWRVYVDPKRDVYFGRRWYDAEASCWRIAWDEFPVNAVRVVARRDSPRIHEPDGKIGLAFGMLLGSTTVDVVEAAEAGLRPRDIIMLCDDSASMSDEAVMSPQNLRRDGLPQIAARLREIWQDLGEPVYGDLPAFEPRPVTFRTRLAEVTAVDRLVEVAFQASVAAVRLKFSDGASQAFAGGQAGQRQRYAGVGPHEGKTITRVILDEQLDVDTQDAEDIVRAWGLDQIDYPAAAGSWDEYVRYVKSNSYLSAARLNNQYGGVTLVHYWLTRCGSHSAFPEFQRTRQYPLQRVKDAAGQLADLLTPGRLHHWRPLAYSRRPVLLPPQDLNALQRPPGPELLDSLRGRQAGHEGQPGVDLGTALSAAAALLQKQGRPGAEPVILVFSNSTPSLHSANWVRPGQWQWNRYTDYDGDGTADYTTLELSHWSAVTVAVDFAKAGGVVHAVSVGDACDEEVMRAVAFASQGEFLPAAEARQAEKLEDFLRRAVLDRPQAILLHD